MNIRKIIKEGIDNSFEWTDGIPSNPIEWVESNRTAEYDDEGSILEEGNGEGEVWIDFERYNTEERIEIFHSIEKYLGSPLLIQHGPDNSDRDVKVIECTSYDMKGFLLHCGHEDNHFFSTENSVCCMNQNYNEFMDDERADRPNEDVPERPVVDGGMFLNKNLTESFFYKGVNPTVDLIVIRDNKVLLIQRADDAEAEPGKWALPGGFHDTNAKEGDEWKEDKETSLEAAKREVKEETGLDVNSIKGLNFVMVGVFEGGGRDPRDKEDAWTRSTVYMVHIPKHEGDDVKGMDDAQRAEWVPINKVLQHKLAFDHHKIIEKALKMNETDAFSDLGLLIESGDFDWAKDDLPPYYTLEWGQHPLAVVGDEVWGDLVAQGLGAPTNSIFSELKLARKEYPNGNWIQVTSGPNWIPSAFDDDEILDDDRLGNNFEVMSSNLSEPEVMTMEDLNNFMDRLSMGSPQINEDTDFDWVSDIGLTDGSIKDLLSNCEDIPVTNYNLRTKSPFTHRGKMNIMYYSMCPYWWELLKDEPLDDNGRGKGEWFITSNPNENVAVIMPHRNGVTDVRGMDLDDYGAITYDLHGISKYFNGVGSELWLFLDDDDKPRYDLLPSHLVDEVRKGFEGVSRPTTIEESFEWVEEIPEKLDQDLYGRISDAIDNEVSGPGYDQYVQSDAFRRLDNILTKHNIDIEDMDDFFDFGEPKNKNGEHITNYQLQELKQDLVDGYFMLSDEDELEFLGESNGFDWANDINPISVGMVFKIFGNDYPNQVIMKIEIIKITNDDVIYEHKTNTQMGGTLGEISLKRALQLIDEKYWVPEFEMRHGIDRLKESESDFNWAEEIQPWKPGGKYVIDFTTEDEDVSDYLGFMERKRRSKLKDVLTKLGYITTYMNLSRCFYYLEDYKGGRVSDEKWVVSEDDCTEDELDDIYDTINSGGYEILTPTQFFDMVRGSVPE